jgi:hypothetical protein
MAKFVYVVYKPEQSWLDIRKDGINFNVLEMIADFPESRRDELINNPEKYLDRVFGDRLIYWSFIPDLKYKEYEKTLNNLKICSEILEA